MKASPVASILPASGKTASQLT